jgi:hypothetical protein
MITLKKMVLDFLKYKDRNMRAFGKIILSK